MRPSFLYPLFASPSSVRGVGDKYAALLENLGIGKIIDLLWHLPYAVNDRRRAASVHALKNGEINTVLIRVIEHIAPKSRKQPYQVLCAKTCRKGANVWSAAKPNCSTAVGR